MAWRLIWRLRRVLAVAVLICFFMSLYLGSSSVPRESIRDSNGRGKFLATNFSPGLYEKGVGNAEINPNKIDSFHQLGVIVPFRDRFEELLTFVPYIHRYLEHKGILHEIIVVNQVDGYRFNRASLINAGFLYASSHERQDGKPCDYIAMHDVDLLPLNYDLPYAYPGDGSVMHVAAPGLHPKYNYPTFIGGILLVTVNDFLKVNGMSNVYWGWGMEDDEFYVRLKHAGIQVKRPDNIQTDRTDTFRHAHSAKVRPRDMAKCYDQFNRTKKRDRLTGLNNLNYTLLSTNHMTVDSAPLILLNVKLQCDTMISPWCDCGNSSQNSQSSAKNTRKNSSSQNKSNNNNKGKSKPNVSNNISVRRPTLE